MQEIIYKKILDYIQLIRPELPFSAGVSVLMGEIIASGGLPSWREALLGFACGFTLSASALILNDVFDFEVDKVNAPTRPLPAGILSKAEAIGFSIPVTFTGLIVALAINSFALIFSIIIWLLGFLYNWKFKRSGLLGNLLVSTSVAATFILGAITVDQPWNVIVWFFAIGAFLIDLGEEIAGDAMDIEGDKLRGSKSLAIRYGRKTALRISASIFSLVLILTSFPILLGWMGIRYLLVVIVMDCGLVIFIVKLLRSRNSDEGTAAMRGIYLGILAAMLIFILSYIFT